MADTFHTLTVHTIEHTTDDAVVVSLTIPDHLQEAFTFAPGQYLTLRATINGADLRRAYSICSIPDDTSLKVGVRRVDDGRFSTYVNQDLKPGDTLQVMPPQGRFTLPLEPASPQRILAIAAGSGITPILSIIRSVLEQTDSHEVTLVYGNRYISSIMFREELDDLKDQFMDRFRLIHCMSRESQDIDLFNGRIDGERIQALTKAQLIDPKNNAGIYLCGPSSMTESITDACMQLGVDPDRIKYERFTPADDVVITPPSEAVRSAVEKGVAVTVVIDGNERQFMHTDASQSLLESAQNAGIDLPFSCAGGMCATCRCKLVRGDGEMAVNYSLEPWEIEAGFILACQTRPRSDALVIDFDAI